MINPSEDTNTVDVLMESAMYGSQVDSVLTEQVDSVLMEQKDSRRGRANAAAQLKKATDQAKVSPKKLKLMEKSNALLGKAIATATKAPKSPALKSGATKEEISSGTSTAVNDAKSKTDKVADLEVKSIKESIAIVESEIKDEKDPVKKKALESVVKDAKSQIKMIEKAKSAAKTVYAKVSKITNTLVLNNVSVTGFEKQVIRVGVIIATYSVMYGIAKTIPGIKLGSFVSITSNLQAMLRVIKGNNNLVAKQYVLWALSAGVVMNIGAMSVDFVKMLNTVIRGYFKTK